MPHRRQCIYCSEDAVPTRSRCKKHGGSAWARTNPASKGRYGAAWQARRARVLKESPYCAMCGERATDVHHIIAISDGGTDDRSNLRPLCREHHKEHTSEQNRRRRKDKK